MLQPGSAVWLDGGEGLQQPDRPLVSVTESKVFESLSHLLDPNPRRLKRIISVYALVTEVAKRMPLSEAGSKARFMVVKMSRAGYRSHTHTGVSSLTAVCCY